MSIRVVCPNGHVLKVKETLAGKTGLCPHCKARVEVPRLDQDDMSEDAILGLLEAAGPPPKDGANDSRRPAPLGSTSKAASSGNSPPMKSCHKCHQEIEAGIHICPHCHTYIAWMPRY